MNIIRKRKLFEAIEHEISGDKKKELLCLQQAQNIPSTNIDENKMINNRIKTLKNEKTAL